MGIDVDDLLFDDGNEVKFARHHITVAEVQEVFDHRPMFFENTSGRSGSHVMLGPTYAGRMLLVPIASREPGLWRPVTAFEPTPQQAARYRRP